MVIATNLANAHSTGQYLAGLAALAFALAHDTLIHRRQATSPGRAPGEARADSPSPGLAGAIRVNGPGALPAGITMRVDG